MKLVRLKPVVRKKKGIDFTKGRILEEQLEDRWDEYLEEEGEKWLKELEAQMYGPF